jgi:hypothetical protein
MSVVDQKEKKEEKKKKGKEEEKSEKALLDDLFRHVKKTTEKLYPGVFSSRPFLYYCQMWSTLPRLNFCFQVLDKMDHATNILEMEDTLYLQFFMKHFQRFPLSLMNHRFRDVQFQIMCLQYEIPFRYEWEVWLEKWECRGFFVCLFDRLNSLLDSASPTLIAQEEKEPEGTLFLCRAFLLKWVNHPSIFSFFKTEVFKTKKLYPNDLMYLCIPHPAQLSKLILTFGFPAAADCAVSLMITSFVAKAYDVFQYIQSQFHISVEQFLKEEEWNRVACTFPSEISSEVLSRLFQWQK